MEHGTAEVCVTVTEHIEKTYDMIGFIDYSEMDNGFMDCWLGDGLHEWCFQHTVFLQHQHRVPTSYLSTVPAAHEPGTRSILQRRPLSSGRIRTRVVTPSLNTSPRSPISVLRSSSTVSGPPFSPSSCRRADDLLRPAAAATSAPPFFLRGSLTRRQCDTDTL